MRFLIECWCHGELENDAVFKAGAKKQLCPRNQSPHAVDHALCSLGGFRLLPPRDLQRAPVSAMRGRGWGRQQPSCVRSKARHSASLVILYCFIRFLCQHCFSLARQWSWVMSTADRRVQGLSWRWMTKRCEKEARKAAGASEWDIVRQWDVRNTHNTHRFHCARSVCCLLAWKRRNQDLVSAARLFKPQGKNCPRS